MQSVVLTPNSVAFVVRDSEDSEGRNDRVNKLHARGAENGVQKCKHRRRIVSRFVAGSRPKSADQILGEDRFQLARARGRPATSAETCRPAKGKGAGLVMPWCDTDAMAAQLIEISAAVDPGEDALAACLVLFVLWLAHLDLGLLRANLVFGHEGEHRACPTRQNTAAGRRTRRGRMSNARSSM